MLSQPEEQLIGDVSTLNQIKALIACCNCQKQDIHNLNYQKACHHGTYCSQCINFCPQCSSSVGKPIPSLEPLLKNVSIKCKFSYNGCPTIVSFKSLQAHENSCIYKVSKIASNSLSIGHKSTENTMATSLNEIFPNMGFIQGMSEPEINTDESLLNRRFLT